MHLVAIAVAPGLAIIIYILYRDKFDREPASILLASFVWGLLSIVPAIALEDVAGLFKLESTVQGSFVFAFLGVALVEELMKFLPLRFYAFTRRSFDEPLDGIVHGVMTGMGFATLENIAYVLSAKDGLEVGVLRLFLSVPGHASYGAIMGYYLGKAKFDYKRRVPLLLTGILLATFFHGLYDGCLFASQKVDEGIGAAFVLVALVTNIFAFVLALRRIKQHRLLSRSLYKNIPVLTIRDATALDVPLIRTLVKQIWPLTYEKILSRAQIKYMMNLIYSQSALNKQMEAGHQFLIVYNNAVPVGFASFSEAEPGIYKLQKIYVLGNQQGRGTGTFAIEQVMAAVKLKGAATLRLNVNRHNKARGFYERLGFVITKEEKIDIGGGYVMDDYVMEKSLIDDNRVENVPVQSKVMG